MKLAESTSSALTNISSAPKLAPPTPLINSIARPAHTWATVAGTGSFPTHTVTSPAHQAMVGRKPSLPHVLLDLTRSPTHSNNVDLVKAKDMINKVLKAQEETKEVLATGLGRVGRDGKKIRVDFKNQDDADKVIKFDRWAAMAAPQAVVLRPRLISVRIDHVHKSSVLEDPFSTKLKSDVTAELSEKWGVHTKSAQWLSGVKPDKMYGSMVIRVPNREEAESLFGKHLEIKGDVATPAPFTPAPGTARCFKCQKYGHVAIRCPNSPVCSICSGNHHYSDCLPGAQAKCGACGGPHRAVDQSCPEYHSHKPITTRENMQDKHTNPHHEL